LGIIELETPSFIIAVRTLLPFERELIQDMIHAGGVNRDPENRIRLSGDLRFADKDAPHEERWSK
jgi:hypothetical protein